MKKVVLVSPNFSRFQSGNTASTLRIAQGLKNSGISVDIFDLDEENITNGLKHFDSEEVILHCFNLIRCAPVLNNIAHSPLIVSVTGTDFEKRNQEFFFDVVAKRAKFLVCQNQSQFDALNQEHPNKIRLVHKGVLSKEFLTSKTPPPFLEKIPNGKKICLYPAGIRKVKGQNLYFEKMKELSQEFPELFWLFVGPIIESDYGKVFLEQIESSDNFYYGGAVDFSQMGYCYQDAFVLVNGSLSEGLPNTLLEAGYWELPLFCRKNSGNLSATNQGEFASFFENETCFSSSFRDFYLNHSKKNSGFLSWIEKNFSLQNEIEMLINLYQSL